MSAAHSMSVLNATPVFRQMLEAIWPPVCVVCGCGVDLNEHPDCCESCRKTLPHWSSGCRRCALELAHAVDECGGCLSSPPRFERAHAAFGYRDAVARLVQRFKFSGDLAAGRVLAQWLAGHLLDVGAELPEMLVPVPLHRARLWRRGFNQSELLCRDLSDQLGDLPWSRLLRRTRATAMQSELPAERRRGNVRGAFSVYTGAALPGHIALVDDVMTTGATLSECARVLQRAGIARVDVWVVARA